MRGAGGEAGLLGSAAPAAEWMAGAEDGAGVMRAGFRGACLRKKQGKIARSAFWKIWEIEWVNAFSLCERDAAGELSGKRTLPAGVDVSGCIKTPLKN